MKLGYSIIANNQYQLLNDISNMSYIDFLHIDIMDGNFVDDITFGPKIVSDLKKEIPSMFFDVHLMTNDLKKYISKLTFVDRIFIHIENKHNIEENILLLKKNNIISGLAISPDTPIESIDMYHDMIDHDMIDYVMIMTVYPGKCGQKLIEKCLDKIYYIKNNYPNLKIQLDGGISMENINKILEYNIDSIICGSAMKKEGKSIYSLINL